MTTPRETLLNMPEVGQPAPPFTLPAYPQETVSLGDYLGKKNVVLAFYPKDDTPGCTREMCSFSEDLSQFANADTVVLGVSCDSVKSHEAFAAKFNLKPLLLADEGGATAKAYGAIREGRDMANRVLFVIDKQGIVRQIVEGMPDNAELLAFVRALK